MQTGIREKSEQSTQEEMLCIWEGKPPLALFPYSGILFPLMTILLALFLLLSILSVSALAYAIPNVTYRSCYDGADEE